MRIRIVDAFTDRPFAGNPAAVVVLDRPNFPAADLPAADFPAAEWMQRVAAEVNLSETAFVHAIPPTAHASAQAAQVPAQADQVPAQADQVSAQAAHASGKDAQASAQPAQASAQPAQASAHDARNHLAAGTPGAADFALRWFTPAVEVALCGHATLATAHVLHSTGVATGAIRFATRSGVLTTTPGDDGSHTLDFPTAPLTPVEADPRLVAALGAEPVSVHHTGPHTDDLLVELADEAAVRDLRPNLTELATFERRGVVVTARAAGRDAGYDFVSRFFGMAAGVPEDPVTGSAHTALTPFWSARLGGRTELVGYQASARGGYVRVSLRGDRTHLTGRAVTVIDGELLA